jgi:hypothetical protein
MAPRSMEGLGLFLFFLLAARVEILSETPLVQHFYISVEDRQPGVKLFMKQS